MVKRILDRDRRMQTLRRVVIGGGESHGPNPIH